MTTANIIPYKRIITVLCSCAVSFCTTFINGESILINCSEMKKAHVVGILLKATMKTESLPTA